MSDLNTLLGEAAEEVLENMFFSGVMGEMEDDPGVSSNGCDRMCATVSFSGSSHGELSVSTGSAAAAVLAAGFLGEDDTVPSAQIRAVVGELANVLCGVVLGRMNPDGNFVISPPEVTDDADFNDMELRRRFELMEGDLAVGLTVH